MRDTRSEEREMRKDEKEVSRLSPLASRSSKRKCLVTGESHDKVDLLRFVRSPDGTLTFDLNQKLPGRGAYVVPHAAALQTALAKNLFSKSFKDKTKIPDGLGPEVLRQMRAAMLQLLAMARRAGEAAAGAEKAIEFSRRNTIGAAILAADAGRDGQQLAQKLADDRPIITLFDRNELGTIFGREQAVVVVLRTGGLAKRLLSILTRFDALKGLEKPKEIA